MLAARSPTTKKDSLDGKSLARSGLTANSPVSGSTILDRRTSRPRIVVRHEQIGSTRVEQAEPRLGKVEGNAQVASGAVSTLSTSPALRSRRKKSTSPVVSSATATRAVPGVAESGPPRRPSGWQDRCPRSRRLEWLDSTRPRSQHVGSALARSRPRPHRHRIQNRSIRSPRCDNPPRPALKNEISTRSLRPNVR